MYVIMDMEMIPLYTSSKLDLSQYSFYKTSGKVKLINLSHSHLHCNKKRNSNKCEHFSST